ncbi:MAG: prolyl oligopeptidase family serine peptidase [Leptolyngbyaceae bacterium]|nr:prolyl oligopeptidase family serine peptidase [Leptolyngbyaceae bacterium]
MTTPTVAPYGSWKSPITADLIVAGSLRLGEMRLDSGADTGNLYWLEGRPTEGGRNVLVRRSLDGTTTDLTPDGFNVRTRVHEYGGGAYIVHNGTVYFSNFADQRLYRQEPGSEPVALTPESDNADLRYADAVMDGGRDRLICVCENHTHGSEAINTLTAIPLSPTHPLTTPTPLTSGHDFYSSPRISPDGNQLAWMTWDHPDMPWDGTELWLADITAAGSLANITKIAGSRTEAIFQPEWSPDGVLYFVSDGATPLRQEYRTDWWNLYRYVDGKVEAVCPKNGDFGLPHWVFRMSTYGFESATSLICTYSENGIQHLARINTQTLDIRDIEIPYTSMGGLQVGSGIALLGAASPTQSGCIIKLDLTTGDTTVLQRSTTLEVDPGYLSVPEVVEFPTENGVTAFGFYYPPVNQDYAAPDSEKPPLLVKIHGGPTAATSTSLSLRIQYWTSRGIAILDVDYGGSTGYGRAYRERLKGNWGVVDVDDCVNGATYLVQQGKADGDRLLIDGGSAGGYTTLAALTFRNTFKAGASFYGVSDAEALAQDTHKFESRYLDSLIGPYPEAKDVYVARSPIHAVDQLSCPVIFFQGDEDKIVPPNQAEMMVKALKAKGLPVAYVLYEGEQHGFRKAENIKRTLDGEFYFYSRVFGFEPADEIEPIAIANLDE